MGNCSAEPLWFLGVRSQQPGRGSALTTRLGVVGVGETTELAAAARAEPGPNSQCSASTWPVLSGPWALEVLRIQVRLRGDLAPLGTSQPINTCSALPAFRRLGAG